MGKEKEGGRERIKRKTSFGLTNLLNHCPKRQRREDLTK